MYVDDLIYTGNNEQTFKSFKESTKRKFSMTDLGKTRYMERPIAVHLDATRRFLRYLKGTVNLGVLYKRNDKLMLQGWSDSDNAEDCDDRKNTTCYVFMLNSNSISWSSKKQPIVTLSTTGVEFVIVASCAC
ncbi:secreted RxLR effector protein 161-like [Lathyrus oleraceus]|uniref:secreted RxLR effector protein 161-like n=1 Tax=Pisum sativum TaxID=3888 RepID=UPI0021D21D54|nr:secreted RxLR effector protein 161-like [Pisum sativum]